MDPRDLDPTDNETRASISPGVMQRVYETMVLSTLEQICCTASTKTKVSTYTIVQSIRFHVSVVIAFIMTVKPRWAVATLAGALAALIAAFAAGDPVTPKALQAKQLRNEGALPSFDGG